MRESQVKKLETILLSLPAEIAFLKEAILSLARQSQTALEDGGADLSAVVPVLRAHVEAPARYERLRKHRQHTEAFRAWLDGQSEGASLLGPAWTLLGVMEAGVLDKPLPPAPPPPSERFAVNVLDGMKVTYHKFDVSVKGKGVQIIVTPIDDVGAKIARRQAAWGMERISDQKMPWNQHPGRPVPEFAEINWRTIQGLRTLWIDRSSRLVDGANYLLDIGANHANIIVGSTRKNHPIDVTLVESILRTLRVEVNPLSVPPTPP